MYIAARTCIHSHTHAYAPRKSAPTDTDTHWRVHSHILTTFLPPRQKKTWWHHTQTQTGGCGGGRDMLTPHTNIKTEKKSQPHANTHTQTHTRNYIHTHTQTHPHKLTTFPTHPPKKKCYIMLNGGKVEVMTILILLFSSVVFGAKLAGLGAYKTVRLHKDAAEKKFQEVCVCVYVYVCVTVCVYLSLGLT